MGHCEVFLLPMMVPNHGSPAWTCTASMMACSRPAGVELHRPKEEKLGSTAAAKVLGSRTAAPASEDDASMGSKTSSLVAAALALAAGVE